MKPSETVIQFNSYSDLKNYLRAMGKEVNKISHINAAKYTITCGCSEDFIRKAETQYNGRVFHSDNQR
jgi:hypothetical protein